MLPLSLRVVGFRSLSRLWRRPGGIRASHALPLVVGVWMTCVCVQVSTARPAEAATEKAQSVEVESATTDPCAAQIASLDLGNPALPVPPPATGNTDCSWDIFSWNSFAALNWPVGFRRGFPDLRIILIRGEPVFLSSFEKALPGSTTVWESFKEKREVFRVNPDKTWQSDVDFGDQGQLVPTNDGFCSAADEQAAAQDLKYQRTMAQVTKLVDTLDETAEVSAEARESFTQLCGGYNVPTPETTCLTTSGKQMYPCCQVKGRPVGPRVWKGNQASTSTQPVFYEVKVNYDFFDYVISNDLYVDQLAASQAILGQISLPFRTPKSKVLGDSQNSNAVVDYTPSQGQAQCIQGYSDPTTVDPCRTGAVHLKSAWIELQGEDPDLYHNAYAIYFQDAGNGLVCKKVGQFGLVGFHIIQRVHNQPASAQDPSLGGTFIFSTWEHTSVYDETTHTPSYTYVNYPAANANISGPKQPYPATTNSLAVEPDASVAASSRLLPQTQSVNQHVWSRLDPASVWQNYRLVGTQFVATTPQESATRAQPHYLANLVIETNLGLQDFQGLPPNQPTFAPAQYANTPAKGQPITSGTRVVPGNSLDAFDRGADNIAAIGSGQNMGGCMGCHGVAQQNGYSFSFVLLGGVHSAQRDTESDENIPPTLTNSTTPLVIRPLSNPSLQLVAPATAGNVEVKSTVSTGESGAWSLHTALPGTLEQADVGAYAFDAGNGLELGYSNSDVTAVTGGLGSPSFVWRLVPVVQTSTPATRYTVHDYHYAIEQVFTPGSGMTGTPKVLQYNASGAVPVTLAAPANTGSTASQIQLWTVELP